MPIIREPDRINKAAAKERQGEREEATSATDVANVRSADQTAADIGVSRRKVEEVRAIENHALQSPMSDNNRYVYLGLQGFTEDYRGLAGRFRVRIRGQHPKI